jgi:hypothetical protein
MSVELEWHTALPILLATYQGDLSWEEYRTMCDRRRRMVEAGPDSILLVADTRDLTAFHDAGKTGIYDDIIHHPKIYRTLIVLSEPLYRTLGRAITDTADQDYPVEFFRSLDEALARAEPLAAQFR